MMCNILLLSFDASSLSILVEPRDWHAFVSYYTAQIPLLLVFFSVLDSLRIFVEPMFWSQVTRTWVITNLPVILLSPAFGNSKIHPA